MNDRELLELAARAAGYDVARHSDDGASLLLFGVQEPWNPLTDDGDALRLAVKLEIHVQPSGRYAWASTFSVTATEESAQDPYAATRRAIVRAAAETGKDMQKEKSPT